MAGRTGFEPAATGLKALQRGVHLVWSRYKEQFWEWLSLKVGRYELTEDTAKRYYNSVDRFFKKHRVYSKYELRNAYKEEGMSKSLGNGLRNFFNFLEETGFITGSEAYDWKRFIPLKKSRVRKVFVSEDEILEAYQAISKKYGELGRLVFEVTFYSGLRLTHVVALFNEIDSFELAEIDGKVGRFYISESEEEKEISKGKKPLFAAYMPLEVAERIYLLKPKLSYYMAQRRTMHGRVSPNSIRKFFYTLLFKQGVPDEVIGFIQGRGAESIGIERYLHKLLVADEAYSRVVDELKKVLEG